MKLLTTMSVALLGMTMFSVQAGNLDAFVPNGAPLVGEFNLGKLLGSPKLNEVVQQNEDAAKGLAQFEAVCTQNNLSMDNLAKSIVIVVPGLDVPMPYFLIETDLTESQLPAFFSDLGKLDDEAKVITIKTEEVNGRKFYLPLDNEDLAQEAYDEDQLAITYLAPNVIALFNNPDLNGAATMLAQPAGENATVKMLNTTALAAIAMDLTQSDTSANPELSKYKNALVTVDLVGATQSDLAVRADMTFATAEAMQQTAMQLQLMVPGLIGMAFGKNGDLAMRVANALKVQPVPAEQKLSISIDMPEALMKEVGEYIKDAQAENAAALPGVESQTVVETETVTAN